MKPKTAAILFLALALATLFLPLMQGILYAAVKALFEGNSAGKTVAFLVYGLALSATLWLSTQSKKSVLPVTSPLSDKPFQKFVAVVLLAIAFALILHVTLLLHYTPASAWPAQDNPFLPALPDFTRLIATLSTNDPTEWEASYLGHIHEGKIAFAPLFGSLGLPLDSGRPLYEITPFALPLSILFLVLFLLALLFSFYEALSFFNGSINQQFLVWLLASFAALIVMLDGGFFTVAAQVAAGLLSYYFLRYKFSGAWQPWQRILGALAILGAAQFLATYFVNVMVAATYAVSLVVFLLLAFEAGALWANQNTRAPLALLLLVFGYFSAQALVGTGLGRIYWVGDEATLFVYGLPSGADEAALRSALAGQLDVTAIEIHSWTAFLRGNALQLTSSNALAARLRESVGAESYLFAVPLQSAEYAARLHSAHDLSGLAKRDSAFVSFTALPDGSVSAESQLDPLHLSLLALEYLAFEHGVENPVVVAK